VISAPSKRSRVSSVRKQTQYELIGRALCLAECALDGTGLRRGGLDRWTAPGLVGGFLFGERHEVTPQEWLSVSHFGLRRPPHHLLALDWPVVSLPSLRTRVLLSVFGLMVGFCVTLGDRELEAAPLIQIGGDVLEVSAKHLDVDLSKGQAQLVGEVRITFGVLDVTCQRVDVQYDDGPMVQKARGTGNLRATVKGIIATADSLEVEVAERRAHLAGNVRISRGRGWIQAERASIDLPSGRVSLDQVRGSIPVVSGAR
jgi:lipopolysaccharide export system protein LptA